MFNVQITMPAGVDSSGSGARKLTFTCEAASLPSSDIGTIPVAYFGRIVKFAGDRTFAPWNITVINDEDFVVRDAFESWTSIINTRDGNIRNTATSSPALYKTQGIITQYDREANALRTYTMNGLWPSEVSAIEMSWGAQDQVERFGVVLQYDWFDISGNTGTGGS